MPEVLSRPGLRRPHRQVPGVARLVLPELAKDAEDVWEDTVMDKEQQAIERLRLAAEMSEAYYDGAPLIVTTSGEKDSDVCLRLAEAAGIRYEVQHNHTSADAPETVYHVRDTFRRLEEKGVKCTINWPTYKGQPVTMWSLIPQKLMPPTRLVRYCCAILKEQAGKDRMITTGVRWAESAKRKQNRGIYEAGRELILSNDNDDTRRLFEDCRLKAKRVCNPIIDWTDLDVWDYIKSEHIRTNPLYCEGFSRVGCIGCPMAGKRGREIEFARWPTYRSAYIRAFEKMLEVRKERGKMNGTCRIGTTGEDVFNWWMEYDIVPGQIAFEELEDGTE